MTGCKRLKNNINSELWLDELEKAKFYFTPKDIKTYKKEWAEDSLLNDEELAEQKEELDKYLKGINDAETLEELAEVLNNYTDVFDNGSIYFVEGADTIEGGYN